MPHPFAPLRVASCKLGSFCPYTETFLKRIKKQTFLQRSGTLKGEEKNWTRFMYHLELRESFEERGSIKNNRIPTTLPWSSQYFLSRCSITARLKTQEEDLT